MSAAPDALRGAIEDFAAVLTKGTGSVPAVDVAWKLRQILADPNLGVPDANVTASAPVALRPAAHLVEEVQRANRRLISHIVASAHLLDKPFSNAADQSPWTLLKLDMAQLKAAINALADAESHEDAAS